MTPPTLTFALKNSTNSSNVTAYVTGRALTNNNALFLLRSDGQTPYYPDSPGAPLQPLGADCAIRLGGPGSVTNLTIPHLAGARIYYAIDSQLTFYINPGPALVEPSVTNPSDPNINVDWGFCEFTFNDAQVFVNISYVDFVSIPVSLTLQSVNSPIQHVAGMGPDGLDTVCQLLRQQDDADHAGWSRLVVQSNGKNLRALSPNQGIVADGSLFRDYYTDYVNRVWAKYAGQDLRINTQAQWGTVSGRVANNNQLVVDGWSYAQPSAGDIFSCSTGPFVNTGEIERGAITARLSAAFNRSTLLTSDTVPESGNVDQYYKESPTNHYSRIVHSVNLDGRGYAFPYDDVAPDGGKDESGSVFSGDPVLLTVAIGGNGASVNP